MYFLPPLFLILLARKIVFPIFENMMFQCQLASCIAIQPKALPWLGKWLVKVKETCKASNLVNWALRSHFPSHGRALGGFSGLVAVWHWNMVFSNNWHIFFNYSRKFSGHFVWFCPLFPILTQIIFLKSIFRPEIVIGSLQLICRWIGNFLNFNFRHQPTF